jgi:hypothetical protein
LVQQAAHGIHIPVVIGHIGHGHQHILLLGRGQPGLDGTNHPRPRVLEQRQVEARVLPGPHHGQGVVLVEVIDDDDAMGRGHPGGDGVQGEPDILPFVVDRDDDVEAGWGHDGRI